MGKLVQDPALSYHGSAQTCLEHQHAAQGHTQDTDGFTALTRLHAGIEPVGSNAQIGEGLFQVGQQHMGRAALVAAGGCPIVHSCFQSFLCCRADHSF